MPVHTEKERPYKFCSSDSGQREYKVTNVFINRSVVVLVIINLSYAEYEATIAGLQK